VDNKDKDFEEEYTIIAIDSIVSRSPIEVNG
jgi:hypothetical protein